MVFYLGRVHMSPNILACISPSLDTKQSYIKQIIIQAMRNFLILISVKALAVQCQAKRTTKSTGTVKTINRQASEFMSIRISCQTYPYISNFLIQIALHESDCHNWLQPWPAKNDVHTHLFYRICKMARPIDTPLCRIVVFLTHAEALWALASGIIYSKWRT